MNFLAHAYLSGNDENLLLGNFIADSIKGIQLNRYDAAIQRGVLLHRAIDHFTDTHKEVKTAVTIMQPQFRKYAPVVLDIYFDHFLARKWNNYSEISLHSFAWKVYQIMIKRFEQLPVRSRRILPWMITQNWLAGYGKYHDLERVFKGMANRTNFHSNMENAVVFLKENDAILLRHFEAFFPGLEDYCKQWLNENPLVIK